MGRPHPWAGACLCALGLASGSISLGCQRTTDRGAEPAPVEAATPQSSEPRAEAPSQVEPSSEIPTALVELYPSLSLPTAQNGRELAQDTDSPNVLINASGVYLEGKQVADVNALVEGKHLVKLEALSQRLELSKQERLEARANEPFRGEILFWVDRSTPALVVKSALQTAAFSGYPTSIFVVRDRETSKLGGVAAHARVPEPPPEKDEPVAFDSDGRVSALPRANPAKIRMGATSVRGKLPPDVIQKTVRQNFGRFRNCYEEGLARDPNLKGRIGVRFVIGRNGEVTNVGDAGSDLPDAAVVSCVISSFHGLHFPKPEGGIVAVEYPLLFTPG